MRHRWLVTGGWSRKSWWVLSPAIACVVLHAGIAAWAVVGNQGVDFSVYYLAAKALRQGVNIYTLTDADFAALARAYDVQRYAPPYPYPPLIAGIVSLLAPLPVRGALMVWNAASVLAVLVTGLLLSRGRSRRWIDPMVFGALALFGPIWTTLYAGQANNFVLLSLALYVAQWGSTMLSGCALAFGLMLKPLAAPLLVHLVWRRDWPRLIGVGVGLAGILLVSLPLTGTQSVFDYLRHVPQLGLQRLASVPVTYPPNQSLLGCLGRLLGDAPALARALWLGCSVLLCVGVALLARGTLQSHNQRFGLESGLVLITAVLVVPIGWYHHGVVAMLAIVLVWQSARARTVRAVVATAFTLIGAQGLLWHRLQGHPWLLSLGTYGLLLLYGVTAREIRRSAGEPTSAPSVS